MATINSVVSGRYTEAVVIVTLFVCGQNAYVLIDLGSTHSFVSMVFANKLNRPMKSFRYILCVASPTGGYMLCSSIYPACELMLGNATLYVDLLPLDMRHFDIILGMDWLSKYHATIDCVSK